MNLQELKEKLNGQPQQRFETMYLAFAMAVMDNHEKVHVVETGSLRKMGNWADGQSTVVWRELANFFGVSVEVTTIDIDTDALNLVQSLGANTLHGDSKQVLAEEDLGKIDLLYLDSLDGHLPEAQSHQLAEIQAVWPKLNRCMILLDDHNTPFNKTKLAIDFLRKENAEQIFKDYQILFFKRF